MAKEWRQSLSKCCLIPQRVILAIMGFLALAISYTLRSNLSLAITEMVVKPDGDHIPAQCNFENKMNFRQMNNNGKFEWSEETQGLILSSFYLGYIISHIPAGLLASKFGGKIILMVGFVFSTLITLITPICTQDGNSAVFIVLRILLGIGQGVIFPSFTVLLASWIPPNERSILSSLVFSGAQFGSVIASIISGYLLSAYEWPSVFYFFGIVAVIWCILFLFLCYSNPESSPFISEKEKTFLLNELGQLKRSENLPPTPWKEILRSPAVWVLIWGQISNNWGIFIMVSDLPKYLSDVLNYPVQDNGLITALAFLVMWLASLGVGVVSDFLISKQFLTILRTRKICTSLSFIGSGVCFLGATYSECNRVAAVTLFTLGMGLFGALYSGFHANHLDITPNYAGPLIALTNCVGTVIGMTGPYIVGVIVSNGMISGWQITFWITLGINICSTIVFLIWSSGDVQPWNDPRPQNVASVENARKHKNSKN